MSAENWRIAWYGKLTHLVSEVFEKKYLRDGLRSNFVGRYGNNDILKSYVFLIFLYHKFNIRSQYVFDRSEIKY